MALKDFDDVNPRTRDKNWKEDIPTAQMPKLDEWYGFRIVGGVFSYAQHWIEFKNKQGETKRYPVDCANWDPEEEATSRKGGCPCCALGMRPSIKYMMNAIDRDAQASGSTDPIRALDLPPTVMRQLVDLKKLNLVKGKPRSITNAKFGCDVYFMKQRSKKRSGMEWQIQKGDRAPLTEEELELELLDFSEYWLEPDVDKIKADLKRHGYYDDGPDSDDDEEESVPPKRRKKAKKKRRRPEPEPEAADDDDDDEEDDDDDFEPPRRRKKAKAERPKRKRRPEPEDDDDDDDDDDEEEQAPPRRRQRSAAKKVKRRRPEPEEEDDDDDFDFDDDDDDDF